MGELTTGVNWLAVGVGTLFSFGLGGLWYSPVLFGVKWADGVGLEIEKDARQPVPALIMQLVGTVLFGWLVGISAANEALLLAVLIAITLSVMLIAAGLFGGNSRYAAVVEGAFVIAMFSIMLICHAIL